MRLRAPCARRDPASPRGPDGACGAATTGMVARSLDGQRGPRGGLERAAGGLEGGRRGAGVGLEGPGGLERGWRGQGGRRGAGAELCRCAPTNTVSFLFLQNKVGRLYFQVFIFQHHLSVRCPVCDSHSQPPPCALPEGPHHHLCEHGLSSGKPFPPRPRVPRVPRVPLHVTQGDGFLTAAALMALCTRL